MIFFEILMGIAAIACGILADALHKPFLFIPAGILFTIAGTIYIMRAKEAD